MGWGVKIFAASISSLEFTRKTFFDELPSRGLTIKGKPLFFIILFIPSPSSAGTVYG